MFSKRLIKASLISLAVIFGLLIVSQMLDYYNRRGNNQTRYYHDNYNFQEALKDALKSIK